MHRPSPTPRPAPWPTAPRQARFDSQARRCTTSTSSPASTWSPLVRAPEVEARVEAALAEDFATANDRALTVGLDLLTAFSRLEVGAETAFTARYWQEDTSGAGCGDGPSQWPIWLR